MSAKNANKTPLNITHYISNDSTWLYDYAQQLETQFNQKVAVNDNELILPSSYGTGYIRHWNVEQGITAIYFDTIYNMPVLFHKLPNEQQDLYHIFTDFSEGKTNRYIQDNKVVNVGENSFFSACYHTSRKPAFYFCNAAQPIKALLITINKEKLTDLIQYKNPDVINRLFSPEHFNGYISINKEILLALKKFNRKQYSMQSFLEKLNVKGKIYRLLSMFTELLVQEDRHSRHTPPETTGLIELNEKIEQNSYSDVPKLANAAKSINMSITKFKSMHQQVYKASFKKYHNDQRLNKAKDLLHSPEASITEVAASLGFTSSGHFARSFRQKFGLLPKDYKKQHCA